MTRIRKLKCGWVFTLQSIKSRIETPKLEVNFYSIVCVFTLQSIKSRIETMDKLTLFIHQYGFLLYSPLNQGLKLCPGG